MFFYLIPIVELASIVPGTEVACCVSAAAIASDAKEQLAQNQQDNPNQDRLLQPTPVPSPLPPEPEPSEVPKPTSEPPPQTTDSTEIEVKKIEVTGSTVFGEAEFKQLTEPLEGRVVTPSELLEVVDAIVQLYLDNNYITSDAVLVEESFFSGFVEIRVIEGSVEEIIVKGSQRVNGNYIRDRVRLGASTPREIILTN